jgi:hypothetical protein
MNILMYILNITAVQAKAVKNPVIPIIDFPWLSFETGPKSNDAGACLVKYMMSKVQLSSLNFPAIHPHVNCLREWPFPLLLYLPDPVV